MKDPKPFSKVFNAKLISVLNKELYTRDEVVALLIEMRDNPDMPLPGDEDPVTP